MAAQPAAVAPRAELRGARHQHRHQIGHRGAGDEHAAGALRKAEYLPDPFDDLAFDLDRHVVAAAAIGIQSGRQHFGQNSDRRAGAMHPAHEAGMHIAGGVGRDQFAELAIDLAEIGRRMGQVFAEFTTHRVRNRTPHRPVADIGDVVQHVVEHAVAERAQLSPVGRIERLTRPRHDAAGGTFRCTHTQIIATNLSTRHGRARPGHPRLRCCPAFKTWMPATSAGMTI